MENQKIGNLLNLAMEATERERTESGELDVGYDEETKRWDVVIRYSGTVEALEEPGIYITPLLGNFAVVNLPQSAILEFSQKPGVEFMEKPKLLFFSVVTGRAVSCVNSIQNQGLRLRGEGVLVACIDSGVDYSHPDFRREDGTTRILRLWDQTIPGNPPAGYQIGTEYTQEEINQALATPDVRERLELVPSQDTSGHGTAVLGIMAGNGRASSGLYHGMAPDSQILVVKLGIPRPNSFPRTTELMQGVDYAVKQAVALGMPLVINLSFGNSYGAHEPYN